MFPLHHIRKPFQQQNCDVTDKYFILEFNRDEEKTFCYLALCQSGPVKPSQSINLKVILQEKRGEDDSKVREGIKARKLADLLPCFFGGFFCRHLRPIKYTSQRDGK